MKKAILVENLSKQYRIGRLMHETMIREALMNRLLHPFRRRERKAETIWALRDVCFHVEEGEVLGVIGRNGAGKSTLLKLMSGITFPTTGRIEVNGRISSLLEVGTGFHEELTGRENIYLNGSILGMKRREIDARMEAIVSFAGVEKFIDTPIKRYSSGMRLRLGFAVAAHLDPDVLLVDEVLAVGDAEFQKKCLRAMGDLHSGGRTVVFVSHNMTAMEQLCQRVVWIDGGCVREIGEPQTVIRNYLSTFADSPSARFDLRGITARQGNGAIRFTGVEFVNASGELDNLIRSGDRLRLRLHYEAGKAVSYPHFGVRVHTDMGTLVTDFSTWSTGVEIPRLEPGPGHADVEVDFLNLMPGRYYVSLWLASVGRILYDVLEHCAVFDVESSNYYQSGRGIDRRFGIVFLPCQWTVNGDSAQRTVLAELGAPEVQR